MTTIESVRPAGFSLSSKTRARLTSFALIAPATVLIAVVMVWPLATMIRVSLSERYPGVPGLTLSKYGFVLSDDYLLSAAGRTFALAIVVTLICAILGYPVAWYLARSRSRLRPLVFLGVIFPLMTSIVVRTMGWTILLGGTGLFNNIMLAMGIIREPLVLMQSFWSVVVGLVHILLPFMILSIATVIGRMDRSLAEASATLGARPFATFRFIILPLSARGIAAGSVIVFCLTIGSFLTPIWLGRGHVNVLAIAIQEQMVVLVDWPTGAALSMLVTAGTLVALAGYGLFVRRWAKR